MLFRLLGFVALLGAATTCAAQAPAAPFRAGVDYFVIEPAQPTNSGERIEVLEAFGYSCGGCASFQPSVDAWKARLAPDVAFSYVPAAWGGVWEQFARAFYAAESLGVLEKSHSEIFRKIHVERKPVRSAEDIAGLYSDYGVSQDDFLATMNSFAVNARIARVKQQLPRYGIESTPTLIVNGKYRVSLAKDGGSWDRMLATVDHLVAQERAAR